MKNYSDLSIIIPTINEKENIKELLKVLAADYEGASVFIADDGSNDGTAAYIEELIAAGFESPLYFLDRKPDRILTNDRSFDTDRFKEDILGIRNTAGLTASVIDSISLITTSMFAVIDADFQHPPAIIADMCSKLDENDMTCAYRSSLPGFPLYRKLITWSGTALSNSVLKPHARVRDPLSGAFAGNIEPLRQYISDTGSFKLEGFKVLFDLLSIIGREIKVGQTGYEFSQRTKGESKISLKHLLSFFRSAVESVSGRYVTGLLIIALLFSAGMAAVLIWGDVNITGSMRGFAKANPAFESFCKTVTDYGNPLYYSVFGLFFLYGLVKKKKRLMKMLLVYLLIQLAASVIITGSLKIIVGRPRPGHGFEHDFFTKSSRFKSFPSGHTTDAFSSAGTIWMFIKNLPFAGAAIIFSLLIGLTRIFVGSHYLLDVTAGMLVGFLTALLISKRFLDK